MREREKDRERERKGKRPLKVDTFLSAPDLLARHLLIRRDSAVPETPTGQGTTRVGSKHTFKIHSDFRMVSCIKLKTGASMPTT